MLSATRPVLSGAMKRPRPDPTKEAVDLLADQFGGLLPIGRVRTEVVLRRDPGGWWIKQTWDSASGPTTKFLGMKSDGDGNVVGFDTEADAVRHAKACVAYVRRLLRRAGIGTTPSAQPTNRTTPKGTLPASRKRAARGTHRR